MNTIAQMDTLEKNYKKQEGMIEGMLMMLKMVAYGDDLSLLVSTGITRYLCSSSDLI